MFEGLNAGVTAPENTAVAELTCPGTRGMISERPRSHSESSRGVSLLCGAFICRSPTDRAYAAEAIIPLFQGYRSPARSARDSSSERFVAFGLGTVLGRRALDVCIGLVVSRCRRAPLRALSATAAYKYRLCILGRSTRFVTPEAVQSASHPRAPSNLPR